jgi:hypothetical protein
MMQLLAAKGEAEGMRRRVDVRSGRSSTVVAGATIVLAVGVVGWFVWFLLLSAGLILQVLGTLIALIIVGGMIVMSVMETHR